ncbi:MAG TPA: response regulator [Pirellulales bacterium]|nr:response regulator [Pirellulales bacterium]
MAAPITTLIVDGDSNVRQRLSEILAAHGCTPVAASDIAAAMAEVERRPIEVLFTELSLADGEGISLVCATRRRWPTSQAVVVAAHASLETSIEALRHRVADFVLKPISDLKIVSALERARANVQRQAQAEVIPAAAERQATGVTRLLHPPHGEGFRKGALGGNLRDWKQRLVREAVHECHGNKAAAAHALGISRRTLYRILQSGADEAE